MGKAIKKPVEIEFITFDEFCEISKDIHSLYPDRIEFIFNGYNVIKKNDECFIIQTLEGFHNFTPQDVLIIGVKGEIYPCKIDIFEQTYTILDE